MKALAEAAHRRGKLVVTHIATLPDAMTAIEAGTDGLAHLFAGPASAPDFGKIAAAHHIFVVPTLTVLNTMCATNFDSELADDPRLKPYLPPAATAAMKAGFGLPAKLSCEGAGEAVRQLKAARVPILAGTDAGNPGTTQGASIHGELELLVRAGLTPVEALHAATAAASAAFHLDDRGQIAPGKRADLVLVNGDPTTDIRRTRDIVAVWKAGHPIDREAWKGIDRQTGGRRRQKRRCAAAAGLGVRLDRRFRAGRRTAGEVRRWMGRFNGSTGGRQIERENGGRCRRRGAQQRRAAGDRRGRAGVRVPVVRRDVLARPHTHGASKSRHRRRRFNSGPKATGKPIR